MVPAWSILSGRGARGAIKVINKLYEHALSTRFSFSREDVNATCQRSQHQHEHAMTSRREDAKCFRGAAKKAKCSLSRSRGQSLYYLHLGWKYWLWIFFIKMTTPHDVIHNNLVFSASYLCTMAVNRYPRGLYTKTMWKWDLSVPVTFFTAIFF